jgi:branched-chain amino acid transport system ATP-binding protein
VSLLRTENLTKKFGELVAVNDVTLSIEEKGIMAIIGPNGAGKTTYFNLLTGYLTPTTGKIFLGDEEITNQPPSLIVHKGLARSFQIPAYFPEYTVFENIHTGVLNHLGYAFNFFKNAGELQDVNDQTDALIERLGLEDKRNLKSKYLSHGDKKILDIAMSLTLEPEIMLLDEPTSGVSGSDRMAVIKFIEKLAENVKVVIVEHDMDIVFGISDRIVVMYQGTILADGTLDEVRHNKDVQRAYLGGGEE